MLYDAQIPMILLCAILLGVLVSARVTVFAVAMLAPLVAVATWLAVGNWWIAVAAFLLFQAGFLAPLLVTTVMRGSFASAMLVLRHHDEHVVALPQPVPQQLRPVVDALRA